MIDARNEKLLSLAEAAKFFPGLRPGTRMSPGSVARLTRLGCRGVILESVLAGGLRCTTIEAVQRFIWAVTECRQKQQPPSIKRHRSTTREELKATHGIEY